MTQEEALEPGLPEDRFEVRVFTLADHAEAIPSTGKMYINGLGVGSVYTNKMPGALPPLFIAVRLRIPWHKTTEPFILRIRALNPDRTPVSRDPLFEIEPETGRPPGFRVGDEANINAVFGIGGMPIQSYGTIYLHLEVDGNLLSVHQLKIVEVS